MLSEAQAKTFASAIGLSSISPGLYLEREKLDLDHNRLAAVFSLPLYTRSYRLRLVEPDVMLHTPRGNQIRAFGASFLMFPVMCCMLTARQRAPGDAAIFGIALSPEEQKEFYPEFRSLWFDHVIDVLGYLRYYTFDSHFFIIEIQSDVFGQIEDPAIRLRYSHWHRLLLAAFERYVMSICPGARVSFSTPEYVANRYRDLNPNLMDSMYVRLPKAFGYSERIPFEGGLEPAHKPEPIRSVQSKVLTEAGLVSLTSRSSSFDETISRRYVAVESNLESHPRAT